MTDVVEVTVLGDGTAEVVERDYTAEESAQRATDMEAARLADREREADAQERAQARAALLARLGITEDEASLLSESL